MGMGRTNLRSLLGLGSLLLLLAGGEGGSPAGTRSPSSVPTLLISQRNPSGFEDAPLCLPDLGLLVLPGQDARQVGTDNTTLVLDGLARALLGDLLSNTLLVDATVDDGPGDLARVLALEEEGLLLRSDEAASTTPGSADGPDQGEHGIRTGRPSSRT